MRKEIAGMVAFASAVALAVGAVKTEPVAEAAKKVGAEVRFVEEVKGVSRSPNSGAVYLNFGDAYPRQVLSARISKDKAALLDGFPRLLGRVVAVTGRVESTPSGPIVPVASASQLEVRPMDLAGALTETGDGSAIRRKVGVALGALFEARDFAQLEKIEAQWSGGRERFLDGGWKLRTFYDAFSPARGAPDSEWQRRFGRFDEWRRQFPKSAVPVVAGSSVMVDYAWAARGSGWANTVTEESWKKFAERLTRARSDLETVKAAAARGPEWYSVMQRVALGQGWPKADARRIFDEAVAAEPEYFANYFAQAYFLLPRWFGEPGEWEAFLDGAAKAQPGGLGAEIYTRTAWNESSFYGNLFKESAIEWPRMRAGFEEMRRRWPKSDFLLSNFAFFAAMAGDRELTPRLLDELGDRADMETWVSWENVDMTRRWLADASGAAPVPYIFRPRK